MGRNTQKEWSPERAKIVEGWLTTILNSIDGVKNVCGYSYHVYRDFKVAFDYEGPGGVVEGCYLAFLPEGKSFVFPKQHSALEAWTGGLSTRWPRTVMAEIDKLLPRSLYETAKGVGTDPWHYWLFVTEGDLEKLATKLAS